MSALRRCLAVLLLCLLPVQAWAQLAACPALAAPGPAAAHCHDAGDDAPAAPHAPDCRHCAACMPAGAPPFVAPAAALPASTRLPQAAPEGFASFVPASPERPPRSDFA